MAKFQRRSARSARRQRFAIPPTIETSEPNMSSLICRRLNRAATHRSVIQRLASSWSFKSGVALLACLASSHADAQVRTKKPDRGTYQSPQLGDNGGESVRTADWSNDPLAPSELSRIQISEVGYDDVDPQDSTLAVDDQTSLQPLHAPGGLQLRALDETPRSTAPQLVRPVSGMTVGSGVVSSAPSQGNVQIIRPSQPSHSGRVLRKTSGSVTVMEEPMFLNESMMGPGAMSFSGPGCGMEGCGIEACGCGVEAGCGFETFGCDSCGYGGCDGMCGPSCDPCGAICVDPNRWFGSAELMIMFRKGDRLPPLVTTDTSPDTGSLDTGTVLAGDDSVLKDATAGGRLTLGLWLDNHQCRSLVFRGWVAGDETYSFGADQRNFDVLAIPFFNVATDLEDSNVLVFPNGTGTINGRFGAVGVSAHSEVHGADISIRQYWRGGLGTTFDFLYGYQYMRLAEGLSINSSSTLTEGADAGNFISIRDSFEAVNEFHGAQFGLAGRYREGCWSFNWLAKAAFGNVSRTAERQGSTTTGPPETPLDGGLFVDADTNQGTTTSDTFGWVPELDVNLGWHRFNNFDVTIGYHLIAMSDAIQVSGIFDRNINDNNNIRPAPSMRDDTFYIQGIHFGLSYVR